jgi:putative two-component system hydrogenase maturation factor HypX/HoxX
MGLIDTCLGQHANGFVAEVSAYAEALADASDYGRRRAAKLQARAADEARKPLQAYRDEELARMRLNFYGFDPSYHVARYNFVFRVPHSRTPLHLARHRLPAAGCAAGPPGPLDFPSPARG